MDLESVEKKTAEVNAYSNELKKVEKVVTDTIINYEEQNNKLDEDIATTCEDLVIISQQIDDSNRNISELQARIASVNGQSEKFKSQALHYKKSCQAEIMKNKELSNNIAHS